MKSKVGIGVGLGVFALAAVIMGVTFLPKLWAEKPAPNEDKPVPSTEVNEKTKVVLKLQLPRDDAKVTVDGKDFGSKTEISLAEAGSKITVVATWEPNGYTKIVRTRKVDAKAVIELDMRVADPKMPDDITVIYVPTPDDVVEEMCKLGKVTKDDVVYDLGCGDGRMVITAVKKFGAKKGVGVDLDEERVKDSKENAKKQGVEDKVEFRKGDVLKIDDLPDATVVLLYMGEDINLRLRPILKAKLKPGSRVVSHRFTMGDWEPTKTLVYRGNPPNNYDYTLLLWVIGGEKKKQ